MSGTRSGVCWAFDRFTLVPDRRSLLCDGVPVPLMSKAFDTLLFLLENRERVVTKDELLRAVWSDVVVEEGNLTQQIFLLRKAFGDSAQQPRYIVTVPGHGYRFIAPVREMGSEPPGNAPAPRGVTPRRLGFLAGGILVAAGIVLVFKWMTASSDRPWLDPATLRIVKVTESGNAVNAAISPNGRYVAYVENDGDEYSVFMQQIATGGKTQVLGRQSQILAHLAFSRDGEYLYFARGVLNAGGFVLHRVPAIGGAETPILDDIDTPISFAPDGRRFVFMRGAGRESHIVIADAGGSAQRILASRQAPLSFLFAAPAWSPDGRLVAASGADQRPGGRSSVVLLPVDGGTSREIFTSDGRIGGVRWLPDGSGLLTVVSETLARHLLPWQTGNFSHLLGGPIWRIGYPGGKARPITSDLAEYDLCCTEVSADGSTIAGVLNSLVSDLWVAPVDDLQKPRQITRGNPVLSRHGWLPDNETIVYRDLGGRLNAVRKDGRTLNLAVPDGQKVTGGISVCGDGQHIVFQAYPGNEIWRITPNAGGPVRLTSGSVDFNPACSADGASVIYSSIRQNVSSTWRVPIEGGEPAPLIAGQVLDALPSPTGRLIYYTAYEWEEQPVRLRRLRWIVISASDRRRLFTLDYPHDATAGILPVWAPDESGLDYVVTRNGVSNIWRLPLGEGPATQITHFIAGRIFTFAWSPDGKWLSFGGGLNRSDAVIISGQRNAR